MKEDEVRYTFFAAALQSDIYKHTDVSLEIPYSADTKKEIDAYFNSTTKNKDACVFEFKFDQRIRSGGNQPKPKRAGMIFKDLCRLATANFSGSITRRFFIYVTDDEMDNYFRKPKHGFLDFYTCSDSAQPFHVTDEFWNTRCTTFLKQVESKLRKNFKITVVFPKTMLSDNYTLRIFEVFPE